jgi:hypothetical protein
MNSRTETVAWKREFIRNFCDEVSRHLQAKVDEMPVEWDGHELRKLIAEEFSSEVTTAMRDGRSARARRYHKARHQLSR